MHRPYTSSEAAAVLGVSRETARARAANGKIPAERAPGGWLLDPEAVEKMAARHGKSAELRQCERDIAHYRAIIASRPPGGAVTHERALEAELAHRERVLSLLALYRGRP